MARKTEPMLGNASKNLVTCKHVRRAKGPTGGRGSLEVATLSGAREMVGSGLRQLKNLLVWPTQDDLASGSSNHREVVLVLKISLTTEGRRQSGSAFHLLK